jgi:cysteine desulfurase
MPKPHALQPQLLGGGQESGLRSGTESPWLVAAMVDALECRFNLQPQLAEAMADLRDELWQRLAAVAGIERVGRWSGSECLPHHLAVLLSSAEGEPLSARAAVRQLAQAGVAVSSGSACSSGTDQANPALLALGYDPRQSRSGLRFSVGPWVQPEDFIALPPLLESVLRQLPTVELP